MDETFIIEDVKFKDASIKKPEYICWEGTKSMKVRRRGLRAVLWARPATIILITLIGFKLLLIKLLKQIYTHEILQIVTI